MCLLVFGATLGVWCMQRGWCSSDMIGAASVGHGAAEVELGWYVV